MRYGLFVSKIQQLNVCEVLISVAITDSDGAAGFCYGVNSSIAIRSTRLQDYI